MTKVMKNIFRKNLENIKIFLIAFFAFFIANYFYNNIITKSTASNIKFREINVEVTGEMNLELTCKGSNDPNPSSVNRGLGEQTKNNCTGVGKFTATVPQQRFVQSPN